MVAGRRGGRRDRLGVEFRDVFRLYLEAKITGIGFAAACRSIDMSVAAVSTRLQTPCHVQTSPTAIPFEPLMP
jgi:hypothetical protein